MKGKERYFDDPELNAVYCELVKHRVLEKVKHGLAKFH